MVNQNAMPMTAKTAQQSAITFFKTQAPTLRLGNYSTVDAKATDTAAGRTAVFTYIGKVQTSVMGAFGFNTININGFSTAASGLPTYIDFYVLLDNTPSMGVGATPADVTTMVNNTPDQCAFACHQMDVSPNDYYGLAKKLGVTTRIDVVRQATQQLMDTASSTQIANSQFHMAIYTFGSSAKTMGLTSIQSLTTNLPAANKTAAAIDLMTVPYQNYASHTDTEFRCSPPSTAPSPRPVTAARRRRRRNMCSSFPMASPTAPSARPDAPSRSRPARIRRPGQTTRVARSRCSPVIATC